MLSTLSNPEDFAELRLKSVLSEFNVNALLEGNDNTFKLTLSKPDTGTVLAVSTGDNVAYLYTEAANWILTIYSRG